MCAQGLLLRFVILSWINLSIPTAFLKNSSKNLFLMMMTSWVFLVMFSDLVTDTVHKTHLDSLPSWCLIRNFLFEIPYWILMIKNWSKLLFQMFKIYLY